MTTGSSAARFLVVNGVPHGGGGAVPSVSVFLESTPGVYTTTRTLADATLVLFWDRHLRRLADSARVLAESRPGLLGPGPLRPGSLRRAVHGSVRAGLAAALEERRRTGSAAEVAITALVRGGGGGGEEGNGADVFVHLGFYLPPVFGVGGAHLAVAGPGRVVAAAKYSEWARVRKGMEKMRPPLVTELLLTNDGDRILEGSVTNFFIVVSDVAAAPDHPMIEVQTAPISDGVLPGVIRQLVIDLALILIIGWLGFAVALESLYKRLHRHGQNANFGKRPLSQQVIAGSLRLVQHVETIQAPLSYEDLRLSTWKDVLWVMKQFEREIAERAIADGLAVKDLL
uniref:Uncharacterized protein n=1 Tax=Ananas comosus var. bracteatus TaxID=296719 RepID=A0A6V7NGN1_ANACO|nr:unnamed protein product [Ananas comosus var. bracteatus]